MYLALGKETRARDWSKEKVAYISPQLFAWEVDKQLSLRPCGEVIFGPADAMIVLDVLCDLGLVKRIHFLEASPQYDHQDAGLGYGFYVVLKAFPPSWARQFKQKKKTTCVH